MDHPGYIGGHGQSMDYPGHIDRVWVIQDTQIEYGSFRIWIHRWIRTEYGSCRIWIHWWIRTEYG